MDPLPTRAGDLPVPQKQFADYLTLDYLIPGFLFLALFVFLLLEIVIPEIRDLTAFWDAPPGIVTQSPTKTPTSATPFLFKGSYGLYTRKLLYQIEPVSDYTIEARVLHTRHYYSSKNSADLIPFDIGLGWGVMSDVTVLRRYFTFHHYNQGGGRILWAIPSSDIPREYYEEIWSGRHFSNNHLIPANDAVFETLRSMSTGDFVRLKGQLVNITRPDLPGWRWITTKRNRNDAGKEFHWGNGDAQENMTDCDTMFVTEAEILKEP